MARQVPQRKALFDIRQLLARQSPFAYCDACLALRLSISLGEAKAAALGLSAEPGFSRQRRDCYACGRTVELTSTSRKKLLP
jgi:hypothetical protein